MTARTYLPRSRPRWRLAGLASIVGLLLAQASLGAANARADEVLGTTLPTASLSFTLTQGGPPHFADTFVTPYVASGDGNVASWRTQFLGGMFPAIPPFAEGPGVPIGVQLKILRPVAANTLEVVAAGALHDPRSSLQARFGGSYPFFLMQESWLEFSDPGLQVQAGDLVGITIKSDPAIGRYFFPLIGPDGTRIVLRDVGVGDTIDLGDIFTGSLPAPPAVQVNVATIPAVTPVRIDIKPGSFPNTINLGSTGNVPVAIFSTATFDATELDPQTVSLAGASVRIRGRGAPAASAQDIDADGLLDLLVHVDTEALELSEHDTEAVLVGRTFGGTNVQGSDSLRIVP